MAIGIGKAGLRGNYESGRLAREAEQKLRAFVSEEHPIHRPQFGADPADEWEDREPLSPEAAAELRARYRADPIATAAGPHIDGFASLTVFRALFEKTVKAARSEGSEVMDLPWSDLQIASLVRSLSFGLDRDGLNLPHDATYVLFGQVVPQVLQGEFDDSRISSENHLRLFLAAEPVIHERSRRVGNPMQLSRHVAAAAKLASLHGEKETNHDRATAAELTQLESTRDPDLGFSLRWTDLQRSEAARTFIASREAGAETIAWERLTESVERLASWFERGLRPHRLDVENHARLWLEISAACGATRSTAETALAVRVERMISQERRGAPHP